MTPVELVQTLRSRGYTLARRADRLAVEGPAPKDADRAAQTIVERKSELLAVLDAESDPAVKSALEVFTGARLRAVSPERARTVADWTLSVDFVHPAQPEHADRFQLSEHGYLTLPAEPPKNEVRCLRCDAALASCCCQRRQRTSDPQRSGLFSAKTSLLGGPLPSASPATRGSS